MPQKQKQIKDMSNIKEKQKEILDLEKEYFDKIWEICTSEDFISDLALEPPDASVEGMYKRNSDDEALTISTIHSAKGLEWDSVFIIGAVDGRFPSAYSFNSEEEMDEELRLMYVATTRAKNNLYITYPVDMYDYSMNMVLSKPSRFLDKIPDDILELWDISEE